MKNKGTKSLLENYKRLFGQIDAFDRLGIKKGKLNESDYFNTEAESYGVMVSARIARNVQEIYKDGNYKLHGISTAGSSNLYYAKTEDDLADFIADISSRGIDIQNEIEAILYNGEEISTSEFFDIIGPISD